MRIEADKNTLMLHEQVSMLFNAIPNSVLANVFGSLVALFIYEGAVSKPRLYLWIGMLLTTTLVRSLHYRSFQKVRPEPEEIDAWFTEFRIGSIALAAVIGSAGFLLFVYDNESFQLTLALMIVCIAAFAISSLSPRPELAVLFLVLILTPLIGSLYLSKTGSGTYAFWMMLVLLAMLIVSALRLGKTIARSIELTIEAEYRERDLRNSQQRLSLYVKETPLAVIEWDQNLQVKAWNPAAEHIFGYTGSEAQGRNLADLLFPGTTADKLTENWHKLVEETGGAQLIVENRKRDGSSIQCEWFNTLLTDSSSTNLGVMSLVQDVTEKMATEKLKQEFVSIVSHELRTPVTSIKGSLALLGSGILDDDKDKSREMLDIALLNTNRLQLLINDILDVDKLESGKMDFRFRDTDLVKLLSDVQTTKQSYADQYSVTLTSTGFPATCMVSMDPDRIFQVVTNILSNAIKFSVTGGTVSLSLVKTGNDVRISVNNRGEVIPEKDRTKLFGKFFQRDSSTTRAKGGSGGLGLYICQRILEEHGSLLDYESNAATGTTFFFVLHTAYK